MHTCKICGKEFETVAGLGGHSRSHAKSQQEVDYDKNPKKCGNCEELLLWKRVKRHPETEYCDCKCSAIKRNKR